jgi:hypothetical protein
VGGKNIFQRLNKSRKGQIKIEIDDEPKYKEDDRKFDVEIREIVRIRPVDFEALKNSFEEWSEQWR